MNGPRNCIIPCRTNLLGSWRSLTATGTRMDQRRARILPLIRKLMSTRHSPTDLRTRYISSRESLSEKIIRITAVEGQER